MRRDKLYTSKQTITDYDYSAGMFCCGLSVVLTNVHNRPDWVTVTGRLHGTIVGPTSRSDWSVRPVG